MEFHGHAAVHDIAGSSNYTVTITVDSAAVQSRRPRCLSFPPWRDCLVAPAAPELVRTRSELRECKKAGAGAPALLFLRLLF